MRTKCTCAACGAAVDRAVLDELEPPRETVRIEDPRRVRIQYQAEARSTCLACGSRIVKIERTERREDLASMPQDGRQAKNARRWHDMMARDSKT